MGVPPANERQPSPPSSWKGIYIDFAVSSSVALRLSPKLQSGFYLSRKPRGTGPEKILTRHKSQAPGGGEGQQTTVCQSICILRTKTSDSIFEIGKLLEYITRKDHTVHVCIPAVEQEGECHTGLKVVLLTQKI